MGAHPVTLADSISSRDLPQVIFHLLMFFSLAVVILWEIYLIFAQGYLMGYDPYYYRFITKLIIDTGEIPTSLPNTMDAAPLAYFTTFEFFMASISIVSGVPVEMVYAVMGPLSFFLAIACIYLITWRITDRGVSAFITAFLFALAPYNLYRSTMALPEMYSLVFQMLVFYLLIAYEGKSFGVVTTKEVYLGIVLGANIYLHYRSIIVSVFLILAYYLVIPLITTLKTRKWSQLLVSIRNGFSTAVVALLVAIPVVIDVVQYYIALLSGSWISEEVAIARYSLLTPTQYAANLGLPLVVLGAVTALMVLLKHTKAQEQLCLGWLAMTFLLTLAPLLGVYAPPYRFLSYLSVPLAIMAGFGVQTLFPKSRGVSSLCATPKAIVERGVFSNLFIWQRTICFRRHFSPLRRDGLRLSAGLAAGSILVMVTFSVLFSALPATSFWIPYTESDFEAIDWLQHESDDMTVVISYGGVAASFNVSNSEVRASVVNSILSSSDTTEIGELLDSLYPNYTTVYFLIIAKEWTTITQRYPGAETLLNQFELAFNKNGTRIYDLKHWLYSPASMQLPKSPVQSAIAQYGTTGITVIAGTTEVTSFASVRKMDLIVNGTPTSSIAPGDVIVWVWNSPSINFSGSNLDCTDYVTESLHGWLYEGPEDYYLSTNALDGDNSIGLRYMAPAAYHEVFSRPIVLPSSLENFPRISFWLYSSMQFTDGEYISIRLAFHEHESYLYREVIPRFGWNNYSIPLSDFSLAGSMSDDISNLTFYMRPVFKETIEVDLRLDGFHFTANHLYSLAKDDLELPLDVFPSNPFHMVAVYRPDMQSATRVMLLPSPGGFEECYGVTLCDTGYQWWIVSYGSQRVSVIQSWFSSVVFWLAEDIPPPFFQPKDVLPSTSSILLALLILFTPGLVWSIVLMSSRKPPEKVVMSVGFTVLLWSWAAVAVRFLIPVHANLELVILWWLLFTLVPILILIRKAIQRR